MEDNDDTLNNVIANVSKMDISDETAEKIQSLTQALEAGEYNSAPQPLIEGSPIKVDKHDDLAAQYLNNAAKEAMKTKATSLTVKYDDGRSYTCIYLGVIVKSTEVEKGVKAIANDVNKLADAGLIHSALSYMSSVELVKQAGKSLSRAVISYLLVPTDKLEEAAAMCEHAIEDSDDTKFLDSLDLDLPPGHFIIEERLSIAANMIGGDGDRSTTLQDLINMYMSVLPKGTEFVESIACGISGLSVPYELHFKSPLLDDVKRVSFDWLRGIGTNSGKLVQGNILIGVRYFGKDGKELYRE